MRTVQTRTDAEKDAKRRMIDRKIKQTVLREQRVRADGAINGIPYDDLFQLVCRQVGPNGDERTPNRAFEVSTFGFAVNEPLVRNRIEALRRSGEIYEQGGTFTAANPFHQSLLSLRDASPDPGSFEYEPHAGRGATTAGPNSILNDPDPYPDRLIRESKKRRRRALEAVGADGTEDRVTNATARDLLNIDPDSIGSEDR